MKQEIFTEYLEALVENLKTGDAGERTHYSALEKFLEDSGKDLKHECNAFIEPKNQILGIPDFYVLDNRGRLIGHVEVKDVGEDLERIATTDQLKGYLEKDGYKNLILTNYTEWRLYKNSQLVSYANLADPSQLASGIASSFGNQDLHNLLRDFFSVRTAQIRSPKVLAERLAEKARVLRDNVIKYELETKTDSQLESIFYTFREFLLPEMTTKQFADLYAQSVTYGLFVARLHATEEQFNRDSAERFVPTSIPLLRTVFGYLSGAQMPQSVIRLVDEVVDLLIATKVPDLVGNLMHTKRSDDPIVYFYEDFMAEYDPEERELRGQYYTPAQVVSYMVNSVHVILKDKFSKSMGLADSSVHILDPATGTATFPAGIIQIALHEVEKQGQAGSKQQVLDQVLKNMSAFELMMGSYVVGHLKIDLLIRELDLKMQKPLRLYLTNTLDNKELQPSFAPMASELSRETHEAQKVKNEEDVLVIIGNPPYSGHSGNNSKWITGLMHGQDLSTNQITDNYFEVDGVSLSKLGERNTKWLNDDYVKFIRFAEWKIKQAGEGVLAFITNHAWIDNPTFRGMRQSLLRTFDEIYIYDLHGNTKKKERASDGGKDENVFDIQQGVAISIFIKRNDSNKQKIVMHSDLFGLRQEKYNKLLTGDYSFTNWKSINPKSPQYLLMPVEEDSEYDSWPSIKDIFSVSGVGMTTARDKFVTDFDKLELGNRINRAKYFEGTNEEFCEQFHIPMKKGWNISRARTELMAINDIDKLVVPVNYRPFDRRYIFYHDSLVWRTVKHVMQHLRSNDNLAIIASRINRQVSIQYCFITEYINDFHILDSAGDSTYVFPLWLKDNIFDSQSKGQRQSNINLSFIDKFKKYAPNYTEEAIFSYIYAVLHTPKYQQKYRSFLKKDFPHIPWPQDQKHFLNVSDFGQQLINLHLMKTELGNLGRFDGNGNSVVSKVKEVNGKVWINDSQFFSGISKEVWDYHIGGYQVLEKWLKSRKGKSLDPDNVTHFRQVAAIIDKTIEIQDKLNKSYATI